MTKIICTGRPGHGGIAASLEKFYPDTLFVSKSLGWDLTDSFDYNRFLQESRFYDVLVNHAQVELGFQEKALGDIVDLWKRLGHRGHIISIGSIIELDEWKWLDEITAKEKLSIRNTSLRLNSEKIKTTHLIVSGFNRYGPEEDVKIEPDDIVKAIKFVLESDIDIPLLYVERTNDARLQKWRDIKSF